MWWYDIISRWWVVRNGMAYLGGLVQQMAKTDSNIKQTGSSPSTISLLKDKFQPRYKKNTVDLHAFLSEQFYKNNEPRF